MAAWDTLGGQAGSTQALTATVQVNGLAPLPHQTQTPHREPLVWGLCLVREGRVGWWLGLEILVGWWLGLVGWCRCVGG